MKLDAKNVSVSIAGKPIVRNLSIEVPDRKFSALLGANGSGKTTLLRSIYRTQKMDSGIVRLDDKDITHFSGKKLARNMAVMGQFNQINFDYTVLDIALMGRYPFHSLLEQEKERDYEMALEALDKVGMKSYRDRNFQSLSGGEKQRVVLARALTQSPKILILDEPTNHLDIRYRLEILSIIKDLQITVLAALHDLSLAAQFCDYLYLMKQGEIVTQGMPEAVMTSENLHRIFDVEACVYPSPINDDSISITKTREYPAERGTFMKKKTLSVAAAALAAVILTTGCGQTASSVASSAAASSEVASSVAESTVSAEETSYPLTLQIYDADGNAVDMTYDHAPEKVLSTQLSMTELLIKLGLKDKIVGVFDNDNALKGDIADEVASLNSLGDKKSVSKETILATEPDLILGKGPLMFTESSIGTVQSYQELGIPVYTELASASIDQSLDNIVEDVRNIGEIFNVQETANAYADELQERIDALMDKVSSQSGEPLKVLFMAGYADGTFVAFNSKMSSCMLNALNAENVLDKGGNGLTLENLVSMNPDIIVYVRADRFGSTDADAVEQLTSNAVVQEVPAIANQKVIEMDYDDVMDYGARVIDSAETLYNFMYSAS